jgi:MSHA biogenesis protein MshP
MPSVPETIREQAGLGLPLAISVLLLLAVVAAGVTQWLGAAREGVAAEVTSLRAEAAARSGLEWGRVQAGGGSCSDETLVPEGVGDCSVELRCREVAVDSGTVYALEATGSCPIIGGDEAKRTLRMRVR